MFDHVFSRVFGTVATAHVFSLCGPYAGCCRGFETKKHLWAVKKMAEKKENLLGKEEDKKKCYNPIVAFQAPIQGAIRPALWVPYLRDPHRAKPRRWNFTFPNADDHLIIIKEAMLEAGLEPRPFKSTDYGFEIKGFYITSVG